MRRSRLLPVRPMWFLWAMCIFAVSPWYIYFAANVVQSYGTVSIIRTVLIVQGFLFLTGSALYMLYSAIIRAYELITDRDVLDDTGRIGFFAEAPKPQEFEPIRPAESRMYRAGSSVGTHDLLTYNPIDQTVNPYKAQGACDLVNHQ